MGRRGGGDVVSDGIDDDGIHVIGFARIRDSDVQGCDVESGRILREVVVDRVRDLVLDGRKAIGQVGGQKT